MFDSLDDNRKPIRGFFLELMTKSLRWTWCRIVCHVDYDFINVLLFCKYVYKVVRNRRTWFWPDTDLVVGGLTISNVFIITFDFYHKVQRKNLVLTKSPNIPKKTISKWFIIIIYCLQHLTTSSMLQFDTYNLTRKTKSKLSYEIESVACI